MIFNRIPEKNLPPLDIIESRMFDGGRYYKLPNGNIVPSVTTVLGHFPHPYLLEWKQRVGEVEAKRISNIATTRGTWYHNCLEKYLIGDTNYKPLMPNVLELFKKAKKIVDEHINYLYYTEAALYSYKMKIAGRTDLIAEYDGELAVIDFKTASRAKEDVTDYFEQASGYAKMLAEQTFIPPKKVVIIIAVEDLPEAQVFTTYDIDKYSESLNEKVKIFYKDKGLKYEENII